MSYHIPDDKRWASNTASWSEGQPEYRVTSPALAGRKESPAIPTTPASPVPMTSASNNIAPNGTQLNGSRLRCWGL